MTTRLIELSLIQDYLPVALSTIYSQTSRGNWHWATRVGHSGRRGRRLWVDLDALLLWVNGRGWKIKLPYEQIGGVS